MRRRTFRFILFSFWDVKDMKFYRPSQINQEIFFPAFPLTILPLFPKPELYLFILLNQLLAKSGCKCMK